ncbi:hypothetical protein DSO57_1023618 [Entomophthora muscae]|uniref:Uncharacterized protein n=1 Tax=Entomophthora muscae TaxID=34485 RepID=A0ACC2UCH7_9FUNG|nr:hypothetical protein DSO57_1023618 [Entomophthora muscae]
MPSEWMENTPGDRQEKLKETPSPVIDEPFYSCIQLMISIFTLTNTNFFNCQSKRLQYAARDDLAYEELMNQRLFTSFLDKPFYPLAIRLNRTIHTLDPSSSRHPVGECLLTHLSTAAVNSCMILLLKPNALALSDTEKT